MTDTVNTESNDTTSAKQLAPLGEVLLAARTAKKLTQKDVSNNLRYSVNQINALESNDFSALPQPMITRGFIRNYARLLELDAEPLLESYRSRIPDKTPYSMSVQSSMYQVLSGKDSKPWLKYILGSIFILLFLIAWIFYVDYKPKSIKIKADTATESTVVSKLPVPATLPEVALPTAERVGEVTSQVATENATTELINNDLTKVTTVGNEASNTVNKSGNLAIQNTNTVDQSSAQIVSPQSSKTLISPPTALSASAAAKTLLGPQGSTAVTQNAPPISAIQSAENPVVSKTNKVNMSFTAATWVQVTDKSGKIIFEKILSAGNTDGFDGEKPFTMVIGNAKATKLSFLGKPVDLAPYTTENNVARLKLE